MRQSGDLLATLLVSMLFIACTVYVQGFVDEVQSDANITAPVKAFVAFVPTLLVVCAVVTVAYGILTVRRRRG
jgi:cell division protein FtsX